MKSMGSVQWGTARGEGGADGLDCRPEQHILGVAYFWPIDEFPGPGFQVELETRFAAQTQTYQ